MNRPPGKLTKEQDGYKVVFERILNHSIERVWYAITNPEKLKIWFTDFEMKPEGGSPIRIIFRDAAKTVTTGEILEMIPPHKFVWTWEGELAKWELFDQGNDTCRLVLSYSKLSDQYAVGAASGFHTILDRLELMLGGEKRSYPFGTEENDPVQLELKEAYGKIIYDIYPELEAFHPVVLERAYQVPIKKVWAALTVKELLKQWYFDFSDQFKLEVGHVFEWKAGPPDGTQWLHRGKILEIINEKKLVHTWEYPGYSGQAKLTWEVSKISENETHLKLLFEFIEPFDFKEDALRRKNFAEGWRHIVNKSLPEFLQKRN